MVYLPIPQAGRLRERGEFIDYLNKINPHSKVSDPLIASLTFNDWYEYISYVAKDIIELTKDVLILNDCLTDDHRSRLSKLNAIARFVYFKDVKYGNEDLSVWSKDITDLVYMTYEVVNDFYKEYEPYRKKN